MGFFLPQPFYRRTSPQIQHFVTRSVNLLFNAYIRKNSKRSNDDRKSLSSFLMLQHTVATRSDNHLTIVSFLKRERHEASPESRAAAHVRIMIFLTVVFHCV